MRRLLLTLTMFCLVMGTVVAQVPTVTWEALMNRKVVITYNDGTQATGTLALVKKDTVSIILADGNVVTVSKQRIEGVRAYVVASASSSATTTSSRPSTVIVASTSSGSSAPSTTQSTSSRSTTQLQNAPLGCSASRARGAADADANYHSGWGVGGFFLGLIGVLISYGSNPSPAVAPDPTQVNVSCYDAGFRDEARRKDHNAAWGGFGLESALTLLILGIVAAGNS